MIPPIVRRGVRRIHHSINEQFEFLTQLLGRTIKPPSFPYEPQPGLIVDLGMNDGSDTVFYLKKGFSVIAVEANPVLARRSARRLRRFIRANTLQVLNYGITDMSNPKKCLKIYLK